MSILIKGMEMPPKGKSICIEIFGEGGVHEFGHCYPCALAYEIPTPHGRLGDLAEVEKKLQKTIDGMGNEWLSSPTVMAQRVAIVAALKRVKESPTVVEAEGGGEDVGR